MTLKSRLITYLLFISLSVFVSCSEEDDGHSSDLKYESTIMQPGADMKIFEESMHIHINFESETEQTIHHISVKIFEKDDNTKIVYNKPDDKHVHDETGYREYHDDFLLNAENGISPETDYTLEAKVWGHDAGEGEVISSVTFHVHQE